jgi:uncharacterized membrane protein YtjA (UPF0391 family)
MACYAYSKRRSEIRIERDSATDFDQIDSSLAEKNRSLRGGTMLYWTLVFLVIAIIAGILGFTGVAVAAAGVAKLLFIVFLVLFVISLFTHLSRRGV